MAEHSGGPREFFGVSDWEDDDLLSIEEAGERLREEMTEIRRRLDAPEQPAQERARLEARMNALQECLTRQRKSSWDEFLSGSWARRTDEA